MKTSKTAPQAIRLQGPVVCSPAVSTLGKQHVQTAPEIPVLKRVVRSGHAIGFQASSSWRDQSHQSTNSPKHGLNQTQRENQFQLEGIFNQSMRVKVLLASRG